ncbi:UNVERIFIED_CONTAM: morn3 [Trichonephila clavipes]
MDYKDGSTYIGFWMNDKRSGFGKMWYADDATYEVARLFFLGKNNKYEGYWKNDLKHGEGKYFFHEKGVEHSGLWINDIFCCGFYEVKNPNAPAPLNREIPQVTN